MSGETLRFVGKYEILSCLGTGGMGSVYRARLRGLGGATKLVALKLIHANLSEQRDFVLMFLDEMKVAMALTHRNVVQTFDAGRHKDSYYLVMELVEGGTLRHLLDSLGSQEALPLDLALFVAMEVCAALDYAHGFRLPAGEQVGVIHRDICPSNILLSEHGDVKLADFGVAKAMGQAEVSRVSAIKGKLCYMAPEQARGEAGRRSDLFAAGAVLYEMLGQRPLRTGATLLSVTEGRDEVVPPSRLRPDLPASLESLVLRSLDHDPGKRFPSAATMRAALADELFSLQLARGSSPDAHDDLRAFLARGLGAGARGAARPHTAALVARAMLAGASELPTANFSTAGEAAHGRTKGTPAAGSPPAARRRSPSPAGAISSALAAGAPLAQLASTLEPLALRGTRRRLALIVAAALALAGLIILLAALSLPGRDGPAGKEIASRKHLHPSGASPPRREDARATGTSPPRREDARATGASPPRREGTRREAAQTTSHDDQPPRRASRLTPAIPTRPAGIGRLSINAIPWAYVFVDGVRRGETPLVDLQLAAGVHQLRLENPEQRLSRTLRITILPDQTLKRALRLR